MHIDDFAPNLSFFFSNGMDPEYAVHRARGAAHLGGGDAHKYGANERSQKLKYHIQTSGRSLHAQEIDFNDIRTTLQALIAIYDNCNSLHTNAYDEAITTPDRGVACAAPWPSSSSSTASGAWPRTRTRSQGASSSRS